MEGGPGSIPPKKKDATKAAAEADKAAKEKAAKDKAAKE